MASTSGGAEHEAGAKELEELRRTFQEFKRFTSQIGSLRTIRAEDEIWDEVLEIAGSIVPITHHKILVRQEGRRGYVVKREGLATFPNPRITIVHDEMIEWGLKNRQAAVIPIDEAEHHEWGIKAQVLVPLIGKNEDLGILVLWMPRTERELNALALEMLTTLGREAAIDLESTRLYGEIERIGGLMNNILESVPFGIVVIDLNDKIITVNSNTEYLFGIRRFFCVDETYQKAFPPAVAKVFTELIVSTLRGQEAIDWEFEHQLDKKTSINVGVSTSILYDVQNKPAGLLFLCRDMSLSREVQKLRELDQMKTEFVHTVSHELKTPLTAILGGTEILLYDAEKFDDEQLEIIKIIDEGGRRLQSLINDLLDLSKIESGHVELNLADNDLVAVTRETLELLKNRGTVAILTEFDPEVMPFRFDRDKIKQVMENLISNAIKYSPGGGRVTVRIAREDGSVRVDVTDQGLGIPSECLGLIWEKFYRVDSSSTAEIEGTGLGLPITKHIVEMHNGAIWVASEEGVGSIFSFRLPVVQGTEDS